MHGEANVRITRLRERRAVCEFDHGMNDTLRVDDDLDTAHLDAEKPVRLDHFQAFVEQRCGIDGNLRSHVPGRVFQRLLWCNGIELRSRRLSKRPARCSENDSTDIASWRRDAPVAPGPRAGRLQALENCVV